MKKFPVILAALFFAFLLCACAANTEPNPSVENTQPIGANGKEESSPPQEKDNALIELYFTAMKDLYHTDPGLNSGITVAAFDLTGVSNLTEEEKSALIYLVGRDLGLDTMAGTFEELCEAGIIDKEKMVFENGILFEIETKETGDNRFEFNASKWRSGLGAYLFMDCVAEKNGENWSYTVGVQAIS